MSFRPDDRTVLKALVKMGRVVDPPQSNAWIADQILAAGFSRTAPAPAVVDRHAVVVPDPLAPGLQMCPTCLRICVTQEELVGHRCARIPAAPLRADATDDEIKARGDYLEDARGDCDWFVTVARELAAACVAQEGATR